jgi:prepilin peptidase CpaA
MPEFSVPVPLAHATLAAIVCIAAVIDVRTMRLPNWLTVAALAAGLLFSAIAPAPDNSFWRALGGAGAGLAVTLPLYVLRLMGAGDVKLIAGVGAFLGFPAIFGALAYVFIAGGVLAIVIAIWRRSLKRLAVNVTQATQGLFYTAMAGVRSTVVLSQGASIGKLPYGVAICAGTLAWLFIPSVL